MQLRLAVRSSTRLYDFTLTMRTGAPVWRRTARATRSSGSASTARSAHRDRSRTALIQFFRSRLGVSASSRPRKPSGARARRAHLLRGGHLAQLEDLAYHQAGESTGVQSPAEAGSSLCLARPAPLSADIGTQLVYLEIDVLDTDRPGQRPIALRLSTLGKDQGWVGDRNAGNWSWYTVQLIRSDETMVHEWRSHDNEMGVSELRWQTGDFIDLREYEVAEGDVFRVVLNAQYGAWACEAAEAVLRVFTQL